MDIPKLFNNALIKGLAAILHFGTVNKMLWGYVCYRTALYLVKLSSNRHTFLRCDEKRPDKEKILQNPQNNQTFRHFRTGKHGIWLYTCRWLPDSSISLKGVLFLVHGLGEHIGRYDYVASQLVKKGYAVFGIDHQGHGQSEGDRLFVECFEDFVEDLLEYASDVLEEIIPGRDRQTTFRTLPRFLLGHSMGGAIALRSIMMSKEVGITWNGAILSGAALKPDPKVVTPTIALISRLASKILPKLPVAYLEGLLCAKNPLIGSRYQRDVLIPKTGVTARLGCEILNAMEIILKNTDSFHSSFFICHAMEDKVTLPEGSIDFYNKCSSKDKTLKMYPGLYHEILNEDCKDDIIAEMVEWLNERAQ